MSFQIARHFTKKASSQTAFLLGKQAPCTQANMCRMGQNHVYTVYIRYFWQGDHQVHGHIRCIYTVLANPKHASWKELKWAAHLINKVSHWRLVQGHVCFPDHSKPPPVWDGNQTVAASWKSKWAWVQDSTALGHHRNTPGNTIKINDLTVQRGSHFGDCQGQSWKRLVYLDTFLEVVQAQRLTDDLDEMDWFWTSNDIITDNLCLNERNLYLGFCLSSHTHEKWAHLSLPLSPALQLRLDPCQSINILEVGCEHKRAWKQTHNSIRPRLAD